MKFYYSKSTRNFYIDVFVGAENVPADAEEITQAHYDALILGQCHGKGIEPCEKSVARLVDPLASSEEIAVAVAAARQHAYKTEADPLFFKAQRGEATMDEWRAKIEEIRARFPEGQMPGAVAAD